jgi:mannitol 2-dehydrogenase
MVDRLTPVTIEADVDRIREHLGVEDTWPVAAEPFEQWVIEDDFPTGRPDFGAVGATIVADVHAYEGIKIRLLNGGHQAIAYMGQLAGHKYVHEALRDPQLVAFVRDYMQQDAAPTLAVPEGFDLPGYIDELFRRFANPAIADTLARLSTDASNRIPKFVVPTIQDRLAAEVVPYAGARLIASWREFTRQAGLGRFSLDDESAPVLLAAAAGDALEFLKVLPMVAPLADSAEFVDAYAAATADLADT